MSVSSQSNTLKGTDREASKYGTIKSWRSNTVTTQIATGDGETTLLC